MKKTVDRILQRLEELISQGTWEQLESDQIEIKPVPATGGEWGNIHQTVNAFLNTRGGIVILGIKEEERPVKRYVLTGYRPDAEPNIKDIRKAFTDRRNHAVDVADCLPITELRDFMTQRVAAIYVDELPADRKFVFYRGDAFKRSLTGDHRLKEAEISAQEEYREDVLQARELTPVTGTALDDLDVDKLNEYLQLLNRQVKIETMKADIASAMPFLTRKAFVVADKVTTLGMLVCGRHPEDCLQFRCRVHGYVDAPHLVVQDKQVLSSNILPLMEGSVAFVLRNIQVGVAAAGGGTAESQYPEELIRETVNNALAHRDYSIDKYVTITIKPGEHIEIRNPGTFRRHLLIEHPNHEMPLRRIIPEARPRNPKLASVLMVYNKWEGRGIGMATMVNLCLQNRTDLPYYRIYSENELALFLCCGELLDARMEQLFHAFEGYIEGKLNGGSLTEAQRLVLAYIIKSEQANNLLRYTITLTPDNNHFDELHGLEKADLIFKHSLSVPLHPVYMADRILVSREYSASLREMFGEGFDYLSPFSRDVLGMAYRFAMYSKAKTVSAKQVGFALWDEAGNQRSDIRGFDAFYRKVRYAINRLESAGFIRRKGEKLPYVLNERFKSENLI